MPTDVLIVDSTTAGLFAGIAAARSGASATVLTEDFHIGGLQTSGLGNTNVGQRSTIGGIVREFHDRIRNHYSDTYGAESQQVRDCEDGFFFEPHVAEDILENWVREAGVEVIRDDSVAGVEKDGTRLRSVVTESGRKISAEFFVDASYEGDLLAKAGCSYHVGREPASTYGEDLAGIRYPDAEKGHGDRAIQPFDYRLCLTDDPSNRVKLNRPPDYDRERYAWLAAQLDATPSDQARSPVPLNRMPNRKTDSRTGEWVGAGWHYPEASRAERRAFDLEQKSYSAGFLWFCQNERSVPESIREKLSEYGFAADEFSDNENWPWHIYVREARRLIGEYIMTQAELTEANRFKDDSVALGNFYLDVHPVRMVKDPSAVGGYVPEGEMPRRSLRPYAIAYRSLLPRRDEVTNLLVPVALSASHVGFSPIRMEPTWGMLGHAVGTAIVLCMGSQRMPFELPIQELQSRLLSEGQIIDPSPFTEYWPEGWPPQE